MKRHFVIDPVNRVANLKTTLENVSEYIAACVRKKVLFEVVIDRATKDRTPKQLKYLHGVALEMLCDALGFENDDMREYLNGTFFGWKTKELPGGRTEEIPVRTTTTDEDGRRDVISGDVFWKYVEFVQRFGAMHGIVIPDPDPRYWMTQDRLAA